MTKEEAKTIIKEYLYNHRFGYIAKDAEFDRLYEAMKVAIQALEQEPCKVSEYDKDHIWYKGCQYISLRRFLEVKAETEQEPTDTWSIKDVADTFERHGLITEQEPKWIPVSERLPEINEWVVCQCRANIYEVLKFTSYGWYHDDAHCYMDGFVIAWMPLPPCYEPQKRSEE